MRFCSIPAHFNRPNNSFGPFRTLAVLFLHMGHISLGLFKLFSTLWTDAGSFLLLRGHYGVDHLLKSCRWIIYPHQRCAFKSAASSGMFTCTTRMAQAFLRRRNCMMRSCACLLGKEALAYIITHSLPFGGSSPRHHHHHLSQPVPPSCTSFCLHLQDDPHNNGVPSCSRSLSAQQTPA